MDTCGNLWGWLAVNNLLFINMCSSKPNFKIRWLSLSSRAVCCRLIGRTKGMLVGSKQEMNESKGENHCQKQWIRHTHPCMVYIRNLVDFYGHGWSGINITVSKVLYSFVGLISPPSLVTLVETIGPPRDFFVVPSSPRLDFVTQNNEYKEILSFQHNLGRRIFLPDDLWVAKNLQLGERRHWLSEGLYEKFLVSKTSEWGLCEVNGFF